MNRYALVQWPWIGFAVVIALLAQELVRKHAPAPDHIVIAGWRIAAMTLGVTCLALLLMPARRIAYLLGALTCAGLMGYALYVQYGLQLEPCPLCVMQRVAVIGAGIVFLLAAAHNPGRAGAVMYAALIVIVAGAGAIVAGRHVWLQSLPPDQVPACGPGLSYMLETLPFADVLATVFKGSGECAKIDWRFLDITMPGWTLVFFVSMIVAGIALASKNRD